MRVKHDGRMSDFMAGNSLFQTVDFTTFGQFSFSDIKICYISVLKIRRFATFLLLYKNRIKNSISWIPSVVCFYNSGIHQQLPCLL